MIFIISTSYDFIKPEGSFFWGENYFPEIRNYIPLNTTDVLAINEAILYFNKTAYKEKPALKLKITQSHITRYYLKLNYSIVEEIKFHSYQVRDTLKNYLQKKSVLELPFCAAVEKEKFFSILNSSELTSKIKHLELNHNWSAIYNILEQNQPIENSEFWNREDLLNSFSFATAKLSECSVNLKKNFPDKEKRNEFIKQKKAFRDLTIKLRERCIELNPDNPAFYSNLAYTYYQSLNELSAPNGRRDGNVIKEAEKALKYIDRALQIDSLRITDRYRKAIILSEILPSYTLYKNSGIDENDNSETIKDKYDSAIDLIKRGVEELINLVHIYENNSNNIQNSKTVDALKKSYNKYYIKSLYHIAQKKVKLTKIDFNLTNLIYGYKPLSIQADNQNRIITDLNIANFYIETCIQKDYTKKKEEKYLIDLVECDNFVPAVYKAYQKGLIESFLFLITDKTKHLNTAKEFYNKALELNFPRQISNQNKLFVIEKIAALNLVEGKYDSAIKMLERILFRDKNKFNTHTQSKPSVPEYVAYTLCIAYILSNQFRDAELIIEKYRNNCNKIFERKFHKLKEHLKLKDQKNKAVK